MAVQTQSRRRFHFVLVERMKPETTDRREFELVDAGARSHAARIAHEARRKSALTKKAIHAMKQEPDEAEPAWAYSPSSTATQMSNSFLDPFVQLPMDLTLEERNLLHDYLTVVPEVLYRTGPKSAFCPVRDTTLVSIATNEIWLSWAILLMQHRRTVLRGHSPEDDPPLLHRRRLTYQLMHQKLTAPEDETLSDEILLGLVASGVAEHRVSGAKIANKHLEAGLALFEVRRKKSIHPQLTYPIGLVCCNAYIGLGVDSFFKHYVTLVTTSSAIAQRLRSIQGWNFAIRQCVADAVHRPTVEGGKSVLGHPSEAYLRSRAGSVESERSIVRGHVRKLLAETTEFGTRTCLGALFAVNTVFCACRHDESVAIDFVKDLLYYLAMSEPGPVRDGVPQLTPMAAMYIIGYCGSRIQEEHGASRRRFDLWDVIKFVELMMLAPESTRAKMRQALASWILADMAKPEDLIVFREDERALMIREIELEWSRKQARLAREAG
ncbi:uncharacterized protein HMPREF1541_09565 [Cyphellophora europaea CBS 101466]|uniref:Uncharacterized protein n=1 Tax=Cyphellophora europaea (strain CBS 101466) TaxID=1220924 RepID=W2SAK5_CYPE1|nr:uncharacterized protein HMPREF1541_09565 [Cyphellophora europaea CBS 101466]ETN45732.1 hypothetical protein HMPREF1541_09565 [Cyphellophora europaea CBS 101466]